MKIGTFFLAVVMLVAAPSTPVQKAANLIQENEIRARMRFLAGDDLEGRLSGSHGADIASDYIASEFERLGLKPATENNSYFQDFETVQTWLDPQHTTLSSRISGNEKTYLYGPDFSLGWMGQSAAPVEINAPVVFVGYGVNAPEYGYNDFAGVDLRGKIALILEREPQANDPNSKFKGKWDTIHSYPWLKTEVLHAAGAAGILYIQPEGPGNPPRVPSAPADYLQPGAPVYGRGLTTGLWDLPVFSVSSETANALLAPSKKTVAELQTQIDQSFHPDSFEIPNETIEMKKAYKDRKVLPARNVMGILEGSDPKLKNEYVTVTAHFDHGGMLGGRIYRGADDNASGTIAVIEIARAFVRGGIQPKRSILFIVFDAEERGLLGAHYYITHPTVPLENTVANLNMDMIGRDEESLVWKTTPDQNRNGVNIVGTLYDPDLRKIIEENNQVTGLKLDYKTDTNDPEVWFARSDHFPFAAKSIPMVLFNTGENTDYHTENDTWDRINYPKMTRIVRLVFLTSVDVADSPERIKFTP